MSKAKKLPATEKISKNELSKKELSKVVFENHYGRLTDLQIKKKKSSNTKQKNKKYIENKK